MNQTADRPIVVTVDEVGVEPDELRALFRGHPSGVALVTAHGVEGPVAMTASSLFSVSVAPPLVVFSASALSSSTPALLEAEHLVVHMLDSDSIHLAKLGATSGIDRFADTTMWDTLPTGEPYFHAAPTRFRGKVVQKLNAGAATLLVVQVIQAWHSPGDEIHPIVYHNRAWHALSEQSKLPHS